MPDIDLLQVGVVLGAHGVNGLLKIESLSDNPSRFAVGGQLYARLPQRADLPLTIENAAPHQKRLLLACAEIKSREAAQNLLGATLWGAPDAAPPPSGSYYHYQLLGMKVYENGAYLGELTEILPRPANDVYLTTGADGAELLIPALKSVVKNIDLAAKRMDVELPEGLAAF